MRVYVSDHKISPREYQQINTFSNGAGYKISSKKSVVLLYTNDKRIKKEIGETAPFTIAADSIRYRWVTLCKQLKELYDETLSL